MSPVAKNIRKIRNGKKITQEQLAEKLYVTRQTVSNWETGKSQPDIEALQRIAEALNADITELIYGEKLNPGLEKARKKWLTAGIAAVSALIVAAAVIVILILNGTTGTWRWGLSYLFWNSDYTVDFAEDPAAYSLNIDLNDLGSNVGKILCEDSDGCKIVVKDVTLTNGRYSIAFRAYGTYNRAGGNLVTASYPIYCSKTAYTLETPGTMRVAVGSRFYESEWYYNAGLMYKNGNEFAFYIFPIGQYEQSRLLCQSDIDAASGIVTVTVRGLTAISLTRMSYWGAFG